MLQLAVSNARIDDLLKRITDKTEQYKNRAETITNLIEICENERAEIIKLIKEARKERLDVRTAGRLEDKLSRPYVLFLHNL